MRQILFALLVVLFFVSFAFCANEVKFSSGPNNGGHAVLDVENDVEVEFLESEQEEAQLQASEPATTATTTAAAATTTTTATVQEVAPSAEATTQEAKIETVKPKRRHGKRGKSGFGKHVYTDGSGAKTQRWRRHFHAFGGRVRNSFRSVASSSRAAVRSVGSSARSSGRSFGGHIRRVSSSSRSAGRRIRHSIRKFGRSVSKHAARAATRAFNKVNKDFTKTFGNKTPQQLDMEIQEKGSAPIGDGTCITSCQWFTLPNIVRTNFGPDRGQICGECSKKYIIYKEPCYQFPEAFQRGEISASTAQSIKERCELDGACKCAAVKIDGTNVTKIKVKSGISKVFAAIGKVFKKIGKFFKRIFRF